MNIVLLVLDRQFGDRLGSLPRPYPIWIAESERNRDALKTSPKPSGAITWFPLRKGESAEQVFARIAESLDQHHNELAQVPPYDTLDVYGLPVDADVLSSVRDLGFVSQAKQSGVTRLLKSRKAM